MCNVSLFPFSPFLKSRLFYIVIYSEYHLQLSEDWAQVNVFHETIRNNWRNIVIWISDILAPSNFKFFNLSVTAEFKVDLSLPRCYEVAVAPPPRFHTGLISYYLQRWSNLICNVLPFLMDFLPKHLNFGFETGNWQLYTLFLPCTTAFEHILFHTLGCKVDLWGSQMALLTRNLSAWSRVHPCLLDLGMVVFKYPL